MCIVQINKHNIDLPNALHIFRHAWTHRYTWINTFFISKINVMLCNVTQLQAYMHMATFEHGVMCLCSPGISSDTVVRPSSVSQEELLELIDKMNRDWRVSGLLVQLPLPGKHRHLSCTRLFLTTSKLNTSARLYSSICSDCI